MTEDVERRRALVADRIRTARVNLGLSMAKAANASGVNPNSWRNYERGAALPPLEKAHAIAHALGVSTSYLLAAETLAIDLPAKRVGVLVAPLDLLDVFLDVANAMQRGEDVWLFSANKRPSKGLGPSQPGAEPDV